MTSARLIGYVAYWEVNVKLTVLGLNYSTGRLLTEPIDEQALGQNVQQSLERNIEEIRGLAGATSYAAKFRAEVERQPIDLGDPHAAGWTFLLYEHDPQKDELIRILRPLAEHRGMAEPDQPLLLDSKAPEDWIDWILENYFNPEQKSAPSYVLIVGGPDQVPFRFQSLLSTAAHVGRVALGPHADDPMVDLRMLEAYIDKVIRLEKAAEPATTRDVLFFATDHGLPDPTYFSHHYMANPLCEYVREELSYTTRYIQGDSATKEQFRDALNIARPCLVYTASHGMGAPNLPLQKQLRINGAICCQPTGHGGKMEDRLFMADEVPTKEPFLEGAVFFQFACFGYGTPAESEFSHWNPSVAKVNAQADFIAALPMQLLSNPHGPIAYVGHLDLAWLHGFDDPESPHILERWHARIEPFKKAVDMLLAAQPVGLAMADMTKKYDIGNAVLTSTYERLRKGKIKQTPEFYNRLASMFITRNYAQNYMILGDPAARLRIAAE